MGKKGGVSSSGIKVKCLDLSGAGESGIQNTSIVLFTGNALLAPHQKMHLELMLKD